MAGPSPLTKRVRWNSAKAAAAVVVDIVAVAAVVVAAETVAIVVAVTVAVETVAIAAAGTKPIPDSQKGGSRNGAAFFCGCAPVG